MVDKSLIVFAVPVYVYVRAGDVEEALDTVASVVDVMRGEDGVDNVIVVEDEDRISREDRPQGDSDPHCIQCGTSASGARQRGDTHRFDNLDGGDCVCSVCMASMLADADRNPTTARYGYYKAVNAEMPAATTPQTWHVFYCSSALNGGVCCPVDMYQYRDLSGNE